jgi:hypothetical protein
VLNLGVWIGSIVEVNQFNTQSEVVTALATLVTTTPCMPGPVQIVHMLDNGTIFGDGVMSANFGTGVTKSLNRIFERIVGGCMNDNCCDIVGTPAIIEIW